ncbi:hypothetical protein Pcinc_029613 [Petrolisthes cinctipes]|uniref:WAPL domain-containing protein n=1 Tax=Petrolisthes cinctipes TaxID=88211 RepID=A0AAE1EZQ2_PETCI|nr:hypothetical protein Pcinc_029613 [Petrolisthes cinctipes]
MSGRYSRTYSRKKAVPHPPISQFDKLVTEASSSNSTKPSATKTAGHVGKWGITSFTSLRGINGGLGKDDGKRFLDDSPPSTHGDSAYTFDGGNPANGASLQVKPPNKPFSRPRKFFKSRATEEVPEPVKSVSDKTRGKVSDGFCNMKIPPLSSFETPESSTQGSQGSESNQGKQGSESNQGKQGSVSNQGKQGSESNQGKQGSESNQGKQGSVSNQGKQGSVSNQGKQGSESNQGKQGNQVTVKDSVELSKENVFDKLVTTSVPKPNNETVHSSRSSSGIKLKIFKSRNVASCSQETYSSTVELPSDDSRAGSASTSVASSPSTKDLSEENRDSSEELAHLGSPQSQYKDSQVTLSSISLRDHKLSSPERQASPNRTCNTTIDTSYEYDGLIDQRSGLPVEMCMEDRLSFSGNKSNSESAQCTVKTDYNSKLSKSDELNKYLSKNLIPTACDIDTRQNALSSETCDASMSEDFDIFDDVGSGEYSEPQKTPPPTERGESPCNSGGGQDADGNSFDLFSTDFDENEIVDRTSIDCLAPAEAPLKEDNLDDTQEMEDLLFTSQGSLLTSQTSTSSYESYKVSQASKSQNKAMKKSEQPPLVKKRSIFKSRDADRDAKKRATYRHKWHDHEHEKEDGSKEPPKTLQSTQSVSSAASSYDDFDFEPTAPLKRVHTWPGPSTGDLDDSSEAQSVTSVKCAKGAKQFYTVVKNVKKTHQLQESGEFQEFNDDVEYFLDALRPSMPVSTRCLAALNLAQKCMVPAFIMHLRAHGTVIKFFSALSDAHSDHRLAICAATVMFTLSQDRLNMDLDRDSLELMLNLLDTDTDATANVPPADQLFVTQNIKRIRELCHDMQKKGHAKHLNLDNINAGHLAMETLLSLTSKRAGEWFKEELRELGGVEHLVRTIKNCTQAFTLNLETWTRPLLEKMSKVDRCLKVLENVTHQNSANQEYLLQYQNGIFPEKLMSLYKLCHVEVPLYSTCEASRSSTLNTATTTTTTTTTTATAAANTTKSISTGGIPTGELLVQTLLTTIKVLINLTHNSGKEALGSKLLGNQQEVYDLSLHCLLIMPKYLAPDPRFELLILSCCLLLNLVEHSKVNRNILMKTNAPDCMAKDNDNIFPVVRKKKGAMQALVELFYRSEESARQQEAHTNEIIDHDLTEQNKQKEDEKREDEIEETVAKLLQKAGHHMEDTLIAAYTALLTGYCIMEDEKCEAEIRAMLPDGNYSLMVTVLKKFLRFMDLTASTSLLRSLKPTERVVKYMEKLDSNPEVEKEEERKKQEAKEMEFDAFGF